MREIVKIVCNGGVEDNGTWNIAQKLMYVSRTSFSSTYNCETDKYDVEPYECFILDFKSYYEDFEESFNIDPRIDYYTEEDIEVWRKNQRVVFSPIQVYSLKVSQLECKTTIEIETDTAYEVRKLFYLFADLGNGGHSFDGVVKMSYDTEYHVGYFGFDGDGNDRIYQIDNNDDL